MTNIIKKIIKFKYYLINFSILCIFQTRRNRELLPLLIPMDNNLSINIFPKLGIEVNRIFVCVNC